MNPPNSLSEIVTRINQGSVTEADLQVLSQLISSAMAQGDRAVAIAGDAQAATITTGDGNVVLNVVFQADGLQIAGQSVQGQAVETLRQLLQGSLPAISIDWQQVSRTLLEERLQLTTNPMTRGEDIAYQVEQVYVPLGLMERKQVPRRKQDVVPEQGSALYQEDGPPERSPEESKSSQEAEQEQAIEITQRFEHKQFLEQVLQQGQSPKSQGKRIAVIGEPGAGKTTLLQQIARWAAATFPDSIVIWVSLADLSQTKLKEYIFETWLTAVVEQCDRSKASDSIKDALIQQCNQGRVWLLLDGLDEMPVSGNPLTEIQRQLQEGGWLQQSRILLTCRLNLWDGDRNSLTQFDTYRTLEFAYPDQVEQFISQWFAPRSKAELGEALCAALKESGRARIRDLVKNPLRLTLLCFNWYLQQGQLPETQAELYQRYVDRIYAWKQEQFPTTPAQREQLNQALANLSLAAIDDTDTQGQTRFRLRQSFVIRFLQQSAAGETQTLLDLALKIGWLNQIGVDADDPTQAVYAFYHPTFEEYFAALGIDDGRFFLNPVPRNPMAKNASYRIFEPQWRQVFLLWLGRKDVDKAQKDSLIGSMMKFKDGCGGFYSDRAFLLAAVGIAEFKDCTYADAIVDQLMQWKFGNANWLKQRWANPVAPTRVNTRADWATTTFSSTDSQRVIWALVRVLETTQNESTRRSAAGSLGTVATGNETAIRALVRVLETTQDESTRRGAAESLGTVATGNETAIRALVRVLETTQDESTRRSTAGSLGKIGVGNGIAIRALVQVLETAQNDDYCKMPIKSLGEIGTSDEIAIQALVRVLEITQHKNIDWRSFNEDKYDIRWDAAYSLGKIGFGNETAIRALLRILETTHNSHFCWNVAYSLGKIAPGNEIAIRTLLQALETTQDSYICWRAAHSLGEIDSGNEMAVQKLVMLIETEDSFYYMGPENEQPAYHYDAAVSLCTIGIGNETAIKGLVQILKKGDFLGRYNLESAACSLCEIGIGNETVIQELVQILETTPYLGRNICRIVAKILGEIGIGNETAIRRLMWMVEVTSFEDKDTRWTASESLGKIGTGNETAIRGLIRVLEATQDINTRWRVAESLSKIGINNEIAIRGLVQILKTTQDEDTRWNAAKSLGKIGMNSEETISVLVRSLRRHLRKKEAYQLMIKCAETLSYPKFFQAFHSRR
jgi:HEAT repeat protein/energy-coupling factor transporter ATP-binding protein EcfA2